MRNIEAAAPPSAIAATDPLPDHIAKGILPACRSTYESGRITVYFRVDRSNRLLMGGRGPFMHGRICDRLGL